MGWPGLMSPDYMMTMAAAQQQQQLQLQLQHPGFLPTTESFSDLLKKIQPPSSVHIGADGIRQTKFSNLLGGRSIKLAKLRVDSEKFD